LKLILTEDWKAAENAKHELEEKQRKDKKLRQASANQKTTPEDEIDYY